MSLKSKSFKTGIFLLALGLSFAGGWLLNEYYNKGIAPETISTIKIEGADISHKDWKLKGDSIRFVTEAEGKGKAETVIPKKLIPEARKWVEKNNIILGSATLTYSQGTFYPGGKVEYYRRFGSFGVGGGTMITETSIAFSFGILIMF